MKVSPHFQRNTKLAFLTKKKQTIETLKKPDTFAKKKKTIFNI